MMQENRIVPGGQVSAFQGALGNADSVGRVDWEYWVYREYYKRYLASSVLCGWEIPERRAF